MAPRVGFEPTTLRLTAGCSAVELPRNETRSASRLRGGGGGETGGGVYRPRVMEVKERPSGGPGFAFGARAHPRAAPRATVRLPAQPRDLGLAFVQLELERGVLGLGMPQLAGQHDHARSGLHSGQDLALIAGLDQIIVG